MGSQGRPGPLEGNQVGQVEVAILDFTKRMDVGNIALVRFFNEVVGMTNAMATAGTEWRRENGEGPGSGTGEGVALTPSDKTPSEAEGGKEAPSLGATGGGDGRGEGGKTTDGSGEGDEGGWEELSSTPMSPSPPPPAGAGLEEGEGAREQRHRDRVHWG